MNQRSLIVACLALFVSGRSIDPLIRLYNVSLFWGGAGPPCDTCNNTEPGYYQLQNLACSHNESYRTTGFEAGAWNDGIQVFRDPYVQDGSTYMLTQVTVSLIGAFDCEAANATYFETPAFDVYLQDVLVASYEADVAGVCFCPSCGTELDLPTVFEVSGWPNFNYGGTNEFQVVVRRGVICLANATLNLAYSEVSSQAGSSSSDVVVPRVLLYGLLIGAGCVLAVIVAVAIICVHYNRRAGPADGQAEYTFLPEVDLEGNPLGAQAIRNGFQMRGNELRLGVRIGKGSFGEVYKAEWRGIVVAVKKLPLSVMGNKELLREFSQEAVIMSSLRHPNVVQYLGCCRIDAEGAVALVTEYMSRGSVYRLLHDETFEMEFPLVLKIALDTACGMQYLHESSPTILHRDLKSNNLLVDDNFKVKISDFGLSKVVGLATSTMTACGTAAWAAPEVLTNSRYTEKADVYSFGICLWEFYARRDPYEGMPTFQIIFAVGTEHLRPTIPASCPPDYAQLIKDCWAAEPRYRPSFDEIVFRLKQLAET